ncbi:MAG: hypothetical protein B6229_05740 [Spirochaetaceae bacterium 4572_7]|nr:MAG: hypothetical protein B6229_05740 [Spirochaetaceae bacterium 4572_7]
MSLPDKELFTQALGQWMRTSQHFLMRKMSIYAKNNRISVSQLNLMFRMRRHGAFSVGEVSQMFDFSKPAASQLLDKLVHMDYLFREESTTDRRIKMHNLTPKGEDLTQTFFNKIKKYNQELVDSYEPEEYEIMTYFLTKLTDKLQELPRWELPKEEKCLK